MPESMMPDSQDSTADLVNSSVFIGHLAHELRTPLNGALGFAQLMAADKNEPLNKQQLSQLSRLETAGHDMLALLDDVLNLSQVRLDGVPALSPVDLLGVLESAITETMPFADARQVSFKPELPELEAWVQAHAQSLRRVVVSLLTRAVAASEPGGTVVITVLRRPGRYRLVVTDSGPALQQDQVDMLFEPFGGSVDHADQIDPYFMQHSTGLDLAIGKALTEQMGGSIQVWHQSGSGTTIEVELDRSGALDLRLASQRQAETQPQSALVVPNGRGPLKVLYVEDDRLNSLLVKSALSELPGCEVYFAETGEEAWGQVNRVRPDVLLSDLNLPGCSGLVLVNKLRATPDLSSMLCIAVSADAGAGKSALQAGYDAYWSKPVDLHVLIETIRQLCHQRQAAG